MLLLPKGVATLILMVLRTRLVAFTTSHTRLDLDHSGNARLSPTPLLLSRASLLFSIYCYDPLLTPSTGRFLSLL